MFNKLTFILGLFFLIRTVCFAQQKKMGDTAVIAQQQKTEKSKPDLYYILETGSKDYMLPDIELKLNNLYQQGSDQKIFNHVISLNSLSAPDMVTAQLNGELLGHRIITSAVSRDAIKSLDSKNSQKTLQDILLDNDNILLVKTNEHQQEIEFQFTLFIKKAQKITYEKTASVFIDPEKPHYEADMIRTLQNIFTMAKMAPEIYIHSNFDNRDRQNRFYLSTGDSILLQPIIKNNTPEDDLSFFWIYTDSTRPLPLEQATNRQILKNLNKGNYKINFYVTDGIVPSKIEEINLSVYDPPKITASYDSIKQLDYYAGANELIVQRSLLNKSNVRLDSKMFVLAHPKNFDNQPTSLEFNILYPDRKKIIKDHKLNMENPKATQQKTILHTLSYYKVDNLLDPETVKMNDIELNSLRSLPSGDYFLTFQATGNHKKSDSLDQELVVLQIRPLSLVFDESILFTKNPGLYNLSLNTSLGGNLKFTNEFSVTALEGSNIVNKTREKPFSEYFTNIIAYKDFINNNVGIGAGVLFPNNRIANFNTSFGGKVYVKLLNKLNGDLGIAASYYTDFNHGQIFGIHFYDTFFLEK